MDNSKNRFLPFETTDIDDPLLSATKDEINETPETRQRCLQILKEDLKNLKDIEPQLEDAFLLSFLRVSKFDTQKALQRIERYYRQLDVLLDAFKDFSMTLEKARSFRHLWTSPYRLENNSFILLGLNKTIDYRKCKFAERFFLEIIAYHKLMENPVNQIAGVTIITDFEGFNIHACLAYSPTWIKIVVETLMNIFPCRTRAVHVINAPPIISFLYKIGFPLLSKKIQKRVFIHSRNDWRNFHAMVPLDIIPEEYGGKLKEDEMINCIEDIEEMEKQFLKSFAFGSVKNRDRRKAMKIIC